MPDSEGCSRERLPSKVGNREGGVVGKKGKRTARGGARSI